MRSRALRASAVLLALLAFAPAASAAPPPPFPAAGDIVWPKIAARAKPDRSAKVVKVLRQFRPDYRPQIVLAIAQREDAAGELWYKLNLPIRPFGRTGWVPAEGVDVAPIAEKVIVRRRARQLRLYRGSRLILKTRVAVGRRDRPTPLGNFYVTAAFKPVPATAFVSTYAFELSAPANLPDFPGGGVLGIHGTNRPDTIGKAASNGCIRVRNAVARRLKNLVPLGTPVRIVNK